MRMLWPNGSAVRPRISSPYGPRKGGVSSFHAGADLTGFTAVRAVASGVVTFAGWMNDAAGNVVVIDHGAGVTSVYMHNKSHQVRRGERVTLGDQVAIMGSTGNATGNCCHLEIRVHGKSTDPIPYITARIAGTAGGATTSPEEDDMPIIIVQRKNSKLAKGRMIGGGKIQEITPAENTVYRAAGDAVIYVTVDDDTYADLLAGRK